MQYIMYWNLKLCERFFSLEWHLADCIDHCRITTHIRHHWCKASTCQPSLYLANLSMVTLETILLIIGSWQAQMAGIVRAGNDSGSHAFLPDCRSRAQFCAVQWLSYYIFEWTIFTISCLDISQLTWNYNYRYTNLLIWRPSVIYMMKSAEEWMCDKYHYMKEAKYREFTVPTYRTNIRWHDL